MASAVRRLDQATTRKIVKRISGIPEVGERLNLITREFLGKPYYLNSLIGGPEVREVFTATYDGFDCVTLMETALALAWARNAAEVPGILRQIRYRDGLVAWPGRLHYTTDWSRYHVKRGWLKDITRGADSVVREKTLEFLKDFRPRKTRFRYFPKKKLGKVSKAFRDGDLIYFASTRKGLDTFHVGLLFRIDGRLVMRHASRSQGGVVEQDLSDFVKRNTMPGIIVTRPTENPIHK